ncbi:MAG: MaoC family dehydratase [Nocardioidaceae bacterium]
MTRVFRNADQLRAAVGDHLGYGEWVSIDQARIDAFAEATGDRQWIHVDPARAAASPSGGTIAHGFLTLSLVPALLSSVIEYAGWSARVNYGSNRVRFPSPVKVGSLVRAGAELAAVSFTPAGHLVTLRVVVDITYDSQLQPKPAVVAETITLLT